MSYAEGPNTASTTSLPGPPRFRMKRTWTGAVIVQAWEPPCGFRAGHYRNVTEEDFPDLNWFVCGAWDLERAQIYFGGSADAPG